MARRNRSATRWSSNHYYPPYVPVAERMAMSEAAAAKLRKADPDVQPVTITGRDIATSWWGRSWNLNLERYADYSNRIGRGRSYVRNGAVLHLRVGAGSVSAKVQGSRPQPYEVTVTIAKLPDGVWGSLRQAALSQLDSLAALLAGQFPEALKETFFALGTGLFPSPREIQFSCSCPDWASMCKHVAAVLYGVGNRLDQSPDLLFALRQVSVDDLIARAVQSTTGDLLEKAAAVSGDDILAEADIGGMFGIELDDAPAPRTAPAAAPPPTAAKTSARKGRAAIPEGAPPAAPPKQAARRGKAARPAAAAPAGAGRGRDAKPTTRSVKAASAKTSAAGKAGKPRAAAVWAPRPTDGRAEPSPMVALLLPAIGRRTKPFQMADLEAKLPDWSRVRLANTLQRAIAEGWVERVSRGVYRRT